MIRVSNFVYLRLILYFTGESVLTRNHSLPCNCCYGHDISGLAPLSSLALANEKAVLSHKVIDEKCNLLPILSFFLMAQLIGLYNFGAIT
jgi:hypothetical protein